MSGFFADYLLPFLGIVGILGVIAAFILVIKMRNGEDPRIFSLVLISVVLVVIVGSTAEKAAISSPSAKVVRSQRKYLEGDYHVSPGSDLSNRIADSTFWGNGTLVLVQDSFSRSTTHTRAVFRIPDSRIGNLIASGGDEVTILQAEEIKTVPTNLFRFMVLPRHVNRLTILVGVADTVVTEEMHFPRYIRGE